MLLLLLNIDAWFITRWKIHSMQWIALLFGLCNQPNWRMLFPWSHLSLCFKLHLLLLQLPAYRSMPSKGTKKWALSMTFGCKLVETFIGCTSVSIDCCCDSRQSLPCNDALVPQAVGLCCFMCLYKGEKKMLFGKKFSELGATEQVPEPVPTNVN